MLYHAILTTWEGLSGRPSATVAAAAAAAGEASIPDSIHLNYKLKELTHAAAAAAAASSATLEKARARHVVQGAPLVPVLVNHFEGVKLCLTCVYTVIVGCCDNLTVANCLL